MDGGETIALGLVWFLAFLFSTTAHEAAHALVAWRLGDPTAYQGGQVTMNPLPHVQREPFGMVLVPLLSYFAGGWMMGWASAPYDPDWAERYPRRAAWMALAGPFANLTLALISAALIALGCWLDVFTSPESASFSAVTEAVQPGWTHGAATLLSIMMSLNLVLGFFNLMPLPPLDGAAALPLLLTDDWTHRWRAFAYGTGFTWMGLLIAWRVFGPLFEPIFLLSLNLLYPGADYR